MVYVPSCASDEDKNMVLGTRSELPVFVIGRVVAHQ